MSKDWSSDEPGPDTIPREALTQTRRAALPFLQAPDQLRQVVQAAELVDGRVGIVGRPWGLLAVHPDTRPARFYGTQHIIGPAVPHHHQIAGEDPQPPLDLLVGRGLGLEGPDLRTQEAGADPLRNAQPIQQLQKDLLHLKLHLLLQ